MEQTFIMIKPDGVQRGLVGEIISRFEKKGFTLKGLKLQTVEQSFAEKHYEDLAKKPFFAGLVQYIISGPVVAMIWEGKGVVATGRKIIGATNPAASEPGTIRGDFAIDVGSCQYWISDPNEPEISDINQQQCIIQKTNPRPSSSSD
ncbi:hypothetical protein D5086_004806 [Populus alba]|uniref:Uncharacterized protein n=1 Tax=Populus alba TaxID=43335 RepID=A0ACC4CSU0_POPAL